MTIKFRDLTADEIECRVNTCTAKGCSLLLYKDARCDMNILDETVGAFCWQRDHKELKGVIYCGVGILSETDGWTWKWDAGAESYTEKEKGEASDSFKRACFNWGIGRELYTAPFIWIPAGKAKVEERNGKWSTKERFYVKKISIEGKTIKGILIVDKNGSEVFRNGVYEEKESQPEDFTSPATEAQIRAILALCDKHNVDVDSLFKANDLKMETLSMLNANRLLKSFQAKYGK